MALYAIGDLHLSLSTNKPMDVFGPGWANHTQRLQETFAQLNDDDVTVLCGDTSWGIDFEESRADFQFIDRLPGKKIILKGNHDYWWSTRTKAETFFAKHGISTIQILHNNCFFYEDTAICGTRGWFYEENTHGLQDKKVMNRELIRLETSLQAAGEGREKLCFLHYPPRYHNYICPEIIRILERYGVMRCYYGHIHSKGHRQAVQGVIEGINYQMVSADYLQFQPLKIL